MKHIKTLAIAACLFAGALSSCNEDMYQIEEESFSSSTTITPLINVDGLTPVTTINNVQNWTGTGSNRSVLAIQWNMPDSLQQPTGEVTFLAWGYQWSGTPAPTGLDMIEAVAAHDPRLFVVLGEQWGGYIVLGFGYDGNSDGDFKLYRGNTLVLSASQFSEGVYWENGESLDGLTTADSEDLWMGGWYEAYATYWLGNAGTNVPSNFSYSGELVSLRRLSDNSWDAWTCSAINTSEYNIAPQPSQLKAAPANN